MISYSIKMPDMSRNTALAGLTVSTRGMNVTYDENGYAVKAVNYGHGAFTGTSKSIHAASKEAVLAAGSRTGYDGPEEDRTHFSDREFARAVELRRQVAMGELSDTEANAEIEGIRRLYGYSFGASGNRYAAITLPEEQPEEVAKAQAASVAAQAAPAAEGDASMTAEAASVQGAAPQPPEDTPGVVEQLRESYQAQLLEQQQRQTIYNELEELRVKDMIRVDAKETVSNALLELMDEDKDD